MQVPARKQIQFNLCDIRLTAIFSGGNTAFWLKPRARKRRGVNLQVKEFLKEKYPDDPKTLSLLHLLMFVSSLTCCINWQVCQECQVMQG